MIDLSIPKLRAGVNGAVIGPQDVGYDEARTVFYGGIDRRPAVTSGSRTTPTSRV